MIWAPPSEKNLANDTLERKLWDAANQCWARGAVSRFKGPHSEDCKWLTWW